MGQDQPAFGDGVARHATQLAQEVRVRQTVKSETSHARIGVGARDGEKLRHPRQVAVECRIEAGHLRHAWHLPTEDFDQGDLPRQMRQVKRLILLQLRDQLGRDELMVRQMNAAVNDAVPDRCQIPSPRLPRQPVRQAFGGIGVIPRGNRMPAGWPSLAACRDERCASPPIRSICPDSARWRAGPEKTANLMLDEPPLIVRMLMAEPTLTRRMTTLAQAPALRGYASFSLFARTTASSFE